MKFSDLVGRTMVEIDGATRESEEVVMRFADGKRVRMWHDQDCCESVLVEEVHGDVRDLLGEPLLVAEESTNSEDNSPGKYAESWTWTFYRLGTINGSVQMRWLGESNGYYSESVSLAEIE